MRIYAAFALPLAMCSPLVERSAQDPALGRNSSTTAPVALASSGEPRVHPERLDCGIHASGEWRGELETVADSTDMILRVSGVVATKPTTALSLHLHSRSLEGGAAQRLISIQFARPKQPTPDIADRRRLSGEWTITPPLGTVRIQCGGTLLAILREAGQ